jgi:uncharacterized membrane protein (Fun14 family)
VGPCKEEEEDAVSELQTTVTRDLAHVGIGALLGFIGGVAVSWIFALAVFYKPQD